jgi:hypothetical protein
MPPYRGSFLSHKHILQEKEFYFNKISTPPGRFVGKYADQAAQHDVTQDDFQHKKEKKGKINRRALRDRG